MSKQTSKRSTDGRFAPTHGMSRSREFSSWMSMRRRCYYKKAPNYYNYGKRGIKVCGRWLNSFENFYMDMGPRPENTTLDRINNAGNYTPGNCKWSTHKDQRTNQRRKTTTSSKSKIVGVYWNSAMKKWYAGIGINKKIIWLGKFNTKEEAINARKKAEDNNNVTTI